MTRQRILVVDDEPTLRMSVARLLRREGYDVETHDSGFGLAMSIRDFQPDLVVLDIMMPGLTGDTAVKMAFDMQAHGAKNAPFILVLSGMPLDKLEERARKIGASAWLKKPVAVDVFLECVRNTLTRPRLDYATRVKLASLDDGYAKVAS